VELLVLQSSSSVFVALPSPVTLAVVALAAIASVAAISGISLMFYLSEGGDLLVPGRGSVSGGDCSRGIDWSREGHGAEADDGEENGLCEMHVDVLVGKGLL
jgi:hypothetical protein